MGLIKKLLIGTGILTTLALGSGCASAPFSPIEQYQNNKNSVEREYNEKAVKRTNKAKEEYSTEIDKERVKEAEKLNKDLRKNDDKLIKEMVKNAEEKRKYDLKIKELEKQIKNPGTYNLNEMINYTNRKPGKSRLRAGIYAFQAEQDAEREKPRLRRGMRAELGCNLGKGWSASGVYECDSDTQSVANDVAFVDMTSTRNTYGLKIGKEIDLGKGITIEGSAEWGVAVDGYRGTGAFTGSGAPIKSCNTETTAYGGANLALGIDIGKGWQLKLGAGGAKYEGGETRTISKNTENELKGWVGFSYGGN